MRHLLVSVAGRIVTDPVGEAVDEPVPVAETSSANRH
jgi:hypothetical protein